MSDAAMSHHDDLSKMDDSKITREHWKIMFISGMGFFTDAYDLFIIGVVMSILKDEWHPSAVAVGLVTSTALLASAVGAVAFGRIADMVGRKRIYGYEVLVLAAGAIASAFSPDIWWLIGFRVVLGVGIGGDYPVSATLMSEFAGKNTRGLMVSLVFAMQAAGLIVGPLLAAGLLASGLSHDLVWRLLLAFGAVPALAVFQMRRHMAESPRYVKSQKTSEGDEKIGFVDGFRKAHRTARHGGAPRRRQRRLVPDGFRLLRQYGVEPPRHPRHRAERQPDHRHVDPARHLRGGGRAGYFVAAAMMDRIGRKTIQVLGFSMMAVSFAAMALIPGIEQLIYPFLFIYGISYFFTEFGPNATTFVYPAELFPVESRTTGHGIASASGKVGGFVGVFLFPILLTAGGLTAAESVAAVVSLVGILVTIFMLPETKGKSLEELSAEEAPVGHAAPAPA